MSGEPCKPSTTFSGVVAIDPGTTQSAYVYMIDKNVIKYGKVCNGALLADLRILAKAPAVVAIESIASYGMPVGAEVFETCVWVGRFIEACGHPVLRVKRAEVKNFLCHSAKANDAIIRQRIIDLYGGKEKAIGKKATPGPLYGIKADIWQALAVGLTAQGIGGE